eukprot:TRINITY_DN3208_c0_g2_i1.p1 TRINITY_DN3208_c0_g2~~TRINITY_DN3208_c0_g2_i1.p1  ORF type:complete len:122 (-),score=30.07 TRINITY_DN3208_c0_g2_i1:48-413(-)
MRVELLRQSLRHMDLQLHNPEDEMSTIDDDEDELKTAENEFQGEDYEIVGSFQQRIQQLRSILERELGSDRFQIAYETLRDLRNSTDDAEIDESEAMSNILGDKVHMLKFLDQLLFTESSL